MYGVCFFKQKTAYEMRISDWSSDVCSSDLRIAAQQAIEGARVAQEQVLNKVRIERDRLLRSQQIAQRQSIEEAEISSREEVERARIASERGLSEARILQGRELKRLEIARAQVPGLAQLERQTALRGQPKIGRASVRERVEQQGESW